MNYVAHYERLIARARGRAVRGYRERHHVLPRCMGGTNDRSNLVDLTGREHYVAHQLLVKLHPGVPGLRYALLRMAAQCNNGKVYEWIKKKCAEANMGNEHRLGKPQTPHMRAALRASHIGRKNSPETIAKMRAAAMGNQRAKGKKFPPRTPEHCAAISAAKKGKKINRKPCLISMPMDRRDPELCRRLAR